MKQTPTWLSRVAKIGLALNLLIWVPACTQPGPPLRYLTGEAVQQGEWLYQVEEAWWSDQLLVSGEIERPARLFLSVRINVTFLGSQPRFIPEGFELVDAAGAPHKFDWTDQAFVGTPNPGGTRTGVVTFDVVANKKYDLRLPGGDGAVVQLSPAPWTYGF